MIILSNPSKLEIVLGGVVTTNQLPFYVAYVDSTSTTYSANQLNGVTNDTTLVDLLTTPTISTTRTVKYISVQNEDTVASQVSIILNDTVNSRILVKFTLTTGDKLEYTDTVGFRVITYLGELKSSYSVVGGLALGETSSTAYRGDRGKTAYDHSQITHDKTFIGLPNVEDTALSTWAGTTNLTTLGTIATGVWNGTIIGSTKGGTGLSSYTTGDLPYASASNILSKLGIGSTGQVLTVAGGVPTWATPSGGGGVTTMTAIGATPNTNGATISGVNLTLQPANILFGGVVTPSAQTFAGLKTFSNSIAVGYTGSLTFSDSTLGVYGQAGGALELKGSSNQGGGVDLYNFKIGGTRVVNNLGNISHTFASPTTSRQNIIFGGDFTNVFRSVGTTNAVIERNSGQLLFSVNSGESGGYAAFTPSNILVLDASKYIKMSPITATAASAITPLEAMLVFVSDTNGTFTSIGLWCYENGAWSKK